ncbi:unnamed protein product [marine sediment metagenome]|uniref:Uncharacterized protein n=1 Tax=marine sediment metagenome TaxID=412755 RepID=X0WQG7_9ZZZZ
MKAKDLKQFIEKYNIEWNYADNEGIEDIVIFIYTFQIDRFIKIFTSDLFDDGGRDFTCTGQYFSILMKDICDYYGIELNEVFNKD